MKKFLLFLSLMIAQIYAMEFSPEVQYEREGNRHRYSLQPLPVPEINIQECAGCGKETNLHCKKCKVTYYCSKECQTPHWKGHISKCKEIRKAQQGDIAQMRNIFSAYMKKASHTKNKQFIKEGLSWHCKTLIRLRQDKACSKVNSTENAVEHVRLEHIREMEPLVNQNICTEEELNSLTQELLADSVAWAEELTKNKTLVAPFGIRRYGMEVFLNPELNVDKEFIPEDEWYEKRMEIIQQYHKALSDQETQG